MSILSGRRSFPLYQLLTPLLILLFTYQNSMAQDKPIEWGKVSKTDLEMTVYPPDSNASAVILFDYGVAEFSVDLNLEITRHVRIKILSEDGYNWGTVKLKYRKKPKNNDWIQDIDDIEGYTYNLDNNGQILIEKLNDEDIFEEDVDGKWFRKRFTFPKLQAGSIIEYRYKTISRSAHDLDEWTFQHSEPTLWSEFRIRIPEVYRYVQVFQGYQDFVLQDVTHYSGQTIYYSFKVKDGVDESWGIQRNRRDFERRPTQVYSGEFDVKGTQYRWAMKEVPALRKEPFLTTLENFRAKIRFQLAEIKPPHSRTIQILNTWDRLAETLLDSEHFGKQIQRYRILRKEAEKAIEGIENDLDKIEALYSYVSNTIKWNDVYSISVDDLDEVLENKTGNSAEINLILVSMLRDVGFQAHPIITSTRDHGYIQPLYPIMDQFNHVLTFLSIGENSFILDATDPLRPYQLLPKSVLNVGGFLLKEKGSQWLDISSKKFCNHSASLNLELLDDGTISGNLYITDRDYSAYIQRKKLTGFSEENYIRKVIFSDYSEVVLDSFVINHKNDYSKPLKFEIHFTLPQVAQVVGDFIYLNPFIIDRKDKNPFKLKDRSYPVDFAYGQKVSYTVNLKAPQDFSFQDPFPKTAIRLPDNSADFRCLAAVFNNTLNLRSSLVLTKTFFEPGEYAGLRQFFDRIVAAHSGQIVLKKIKSNDK